METSTTNKQIKSFDELLFLSWEFYKRNFVNILKIFGLPFLIVMIMLGILLLFPNFQSATDQSVEPEVSANLIIAIPLVIFIILMIIAGIIFTIWPQAAFLNLLKIREVSSEPLSVIVLYKQSFHWILPLFVIGLLYFLVVAGGFLLLIIPGIIFMVWLMFGSYAYVFEGKRGAQALLRSKQLVFGYWWRIFYYVFLWSAIIIIYEFIKNKIAAAFPFDFLSDLLNVFLFTPFSIIFTYEVYKDLLRIKKDEPLPTQPTQSAGWIYGMSILGVIAIILFAIIYFIFLPLLYLSLSQIFYSVEYISKKLYFAKMFYFKKNIILISKMKQVRPCRHLKK